MKWAVVAKSPDVVNLIEALDVVRDAVTLQDVLAVWDWCDRHRSEDLHQGSSRNMQDVLLEHKCI